MSHDKLKNGNLESVIAEIMHSFISMSLSAYYGKIQNALKLIGESTKADRVYIFHYDFEKGTCSNTYEWCEQDIEPMIDNLQEIPLVNIDPWVRKHIEGRDIYIDDVFELSEEDEVRRILEPQSVKSLLTVPLFYNGICRGFLGLDSVKRLRSYTDEERRILHQFGKTLLFVFERMQINKDLTETKNQLQSVLDTQKELIVRFDAYGEILYVNAAAENLVNELGLKAENNIYSYISKGHQTYWSRIFSELKNEVTEITFEDIMYNHEGKKRWISWRVYRIENQGLQQIYQGVGSDVTEVREAQHELQLERDKLKYTLEASNVGTWELDIKTGKVHTNKRYSEISGYSTDENYTTLTDWEERLHPEEKKEVIASLLSTIRKESAHFEMEYRIRQESGDYIWVRDSGKIITYDVNGDPLKMYGTQYDITEVKMNEMRMRGILHAIDNSPVMVILTDKYGNITYVNQSFEDITGYTMAEVEGENPRILQSGYHSSDFYENMWSMIVKKGKWEGRIRNKAKDGHEYWEKAIITPIFSKAEKVQGFMAVKEDITELMELEELRNNLKEQLFKFSEQVPGAIYQYRLFPDGTSSFPLASKGIHEIYGYHPEELTSDGSKVFGRIHPDDREFVRESIQISSEKLSPWEESYRVILPNKGSRWVQGYAKPEKQKDGSVLWHGYLVDNTEEMEVKKKLAENEEQMRLAVEATDAGLWDWDMKNDQVNFSKKWSAMLGYEEYEITPNFSGWKRLWHPKDEVLISKSINDFLNGKNRKYEIIYRMKTKGGHYKWIMTRGDVIRDAAGDPIRWVGTNIDITSRKEIEHQLERANIQLGKTIEEARSANKLKTAFLANISHEIRTPINAIIGFSYLLRKDTNLKEAQIEKVDHITKSAEHLLSLMNDVLDISKIESGVMELHMKRFSLNTLLQDIEVMLSQQANEKGVQFIIHRLSDDQSVKGDYSKIMQVLLNLLSNGIKYTEEGKVELTSFISQKRADQLQISFMVTDTGLGIPEEDQERLFDLFYHNNYGKKIKGSGLGLQISKKYAEVMGGDITVESEVGTGSVFTFIITLEKVSSLGLNVEYAKEKGSFSEVKPDKSRSISSSTYKIPEYLFKDIFSAAMRGDTSVLNHNIEKVRKLDENTYIRLKELAEQFEYKKIIEWNNATNADYEKIVGNNLWKNRQ